MGANQEEEKKDEKKVAGIYVCMEGEKQRMQKWGKKKYTRREKKTKERDQESEEGGGEWGG